MIEFKLEVTRKKINLDSRIADKFRAPVIFYLANKAEERVFLYTFVILDFKNSELIYVDSYLPENIARWKGHPEREKYMITNITNVHCSLELNPGKDFYAFTEVANYFIYINYESGIMRTYRGSELAFGEGRIWKFGDTFYKDNDGRSFYLSAEEYSREGIKRLSIYRASLDFSSVQKVYQSLTDQFHFAPHVTRKIGDYIFNSAFSTRRFRLDRTGQEFDNVFDISKFIYRDLFKEYCMERNEEFMEEKFLSDNKMQYCPPHLASGFKEFCQRIGRDIYEIAGARKEYEFTILPGKISMLDLKKKTLEFYETTCCAPAHFEIDEQENFIYTSSHNFIRLGKIRYLGPAAIDKFKMVGGEIIKEGTFSDPSGYRFTSHRVFKHKGDSIICTIGQPNRLFIVDGKTMKKIRHFDIKEDVLTGNENLADYVSKNDFETLTVKAFEVSDGGEYVMIVAYDSLMFYDIENGRVAAEVPFLRNGSFKNEVSPRGYYNRSVHANYLR